MGDRPVDRWDIRRHHLLQRAREHPEADSSHPLRSRRNPSPGHSGRRFIPRRHDRNRKTAGRRCCYERTARPDPTPRSRHASRQIRRNSHNRLRPRESAELPTISEKIFSSLHRKQLGVRDALSNYPAYRRRIVPLITRTRGETFGAEFLIRAHRRGLRIGEIVVEPQQRRSKPRIGNTVATNLKNPDRSYTDDADQVSRLAVGA